MALKGAHPSQKYRSIPGRMSEGRSASGLLNLYNQKRSRIAKQEAESKHSNKRI